MFYYPIYNRYTPLGSGLNDTYLRGYLDITNRSWEDMRPHYHSPGHRPGYITPPIKSCKDEVCVNYVDPDTDSDPDAEIMHSTKRAQKQVILENNGSL